MATSSADLCRSSGSELVRAMQGNKFSPWCVPLLTWAALIGRKRHSVAVIGQKRRAGFPLRTLCDDVHHVSWLSAS